MDRLLKDLLYYLKIIWIPSKYKFLNLYKIFKAESIVANSTSSLYLNGFFYLWSPRDLVKQNYSNKNLNYKIIKFVK